MASTEFAQIFFACSSVTLLLGVTKALDLSKACTCNHVVEVVQVAWTADRELDKAKFWSEHEQARQALAETDAARSSLSVAQEKLECECAGLCTVQAEHKNFQDY
jgi:hypothetical protein